MESLYHRLGQWLEIHLSCIRTDLKCLNVASVGISVIFSEVCCSGDTKVGVIVIREMEAGRDVGDAFEWARLDVGVHGVSSVSKGGSSCTYQVSKTCSEWTEEVRGIMTCTGEVGVIIFRIMERSW